MRNIYRRTLSDGRHLVLFRGSDGYIREIIAPDSMEEE